MPKKTKGSKGSKRSLLYKESNKSNEPTVVVKKDNNENFKLGGGVSNVNAPLVATTLAIIHPLYGFQVTFSAGIPEKAIEATITSFSDMNSKFNRWYQPCLGNKIQIRSVCIDAVTMFGPNIGFLFFTASAFDEENNPIPGTVFLRGDSVCCLLIIKEVSDGSENPSGSSSSGGGGSDMDATSPASSPKYYMVVVEEIKLPMGRAICQTPAGMLDGSYNMKGKMIDEIKEETGITISNNTAHYKSIPSGEMPLNTLIEFDEFIPSQGGCDEKIKVFSYACERTTSEMAVINQSIQGVGKEFEKIRVHIKPLSWDIIDNLSDSKLLIAASKFDRKFPGFIQP
jgi:hypothetical protein